jgi:hypothetical protein
MVDINQETQRCQAPNSRSVVANKPTLIQCGYKNIPIVFLHPHSSFNFKKAKHHIQSINIIEKSHV